MKMGLMHFKKTKRASTLTEVLIVLGIISTVMVASISVMMGSLLRIRLNDIEDSASTLMVKALEVAKSPASVSISQDISTRPVNQSIYFLLGTNNSLNVVQGASSNPITTCTNNSVYNSTNLLPTSVTNPPLICVQVEIIPRTGPQNKRIYEVISKVIYNLPSGDVRTNSIKGYRYESF